MRQEKKDNFAATAWLPASWRHPGRMELPTGHHLRPLRRTDVDLHMRAIIESQERLWCLYGSAKQWPAKTLTAEQDRQDLARREADMEQHYRSATHSSTSARQNSSAVSTLSRLLNSR